MRTPGGGTILLLCAALRERIAFALDALRLDTDILEAPKQPPTVVNGFLPPKRVDNSPEFPFIIVRPSEGSIDENGYMRARVALIIGTYSEDFDGHENALIVFQRIMQSLREQPTLDRRYQLEYPLTWEVFDDQKYPFWHVVAVTEWTVPTPVMLPTEGEL